MDRPKLGENLYQTMSGFRVSGMLLFKQSDVLTCITFSCRIRTLPAHPLGLFSIWDEALFIQVAPKATEQRINASVYGA